MTADIDDVAAVLQVVEQVNWVPVER